MSEKIEVVEVENEEELVAEVTYAIEVAVTALHARRYGLAADEYEDY